MLSRLDRYLLQADAYAGISVCCRQLDSLRLAYLQGKNALKLGRRLGSAHNPGQEKRIFWYSDYYVYHILEAAHKASPEIALISRNYNDILQYDARHQTSYLSILLTYLHHGQSYTETAKALHMHRNNVIYHIRRLSERFLLNLEDSETRIQLLLSEHAHQIHPEWLVKNEPDMQ